VFVRISDETVGRSSNAAHDVFQVAHPLRVDFRSAQEIRSVERRRRVDRSRAASGIASCGAVHRRWKSPGVGETAGTVIEAAEVSVDDVGIVVDPAGHYPQPVSCTATTAERV
jgi:hypothetical protein